MNSPSKPDQFLASAAYFVVRDLLTSLNYYEHVLGFARPPLWGEPPTFAIPHRDGISLMLYQAEGDIRPISNSQKGGYWDLYIWVRDIDTLFEEYKGNDAEFEHELLMRDEYGNKEFAVRDPDGYLIGFGQQLD